MAIIGLSIDKPIMMKEKLLHFIWQNKLFNTKTLITAEHNELQILDFGRYNTDGGPDFCNAKIKIDDVVLVGNIELHVYASDWKLHKHVHDKKYNNVILHVVYFHDYDIPNINTLVLNGRISIRLLERYQSLMQSKQEIVCRAHINEVDTFTIENWKERLLIERFEYKSAYILQQLKHQQNDWEKTCYHLIGKYFGSHINNDAFELLCNYLDYKILLKHQDNIFQLEALLYGVAGFLNKDFIEIYPRKLKQEYQFLKHKYGLQQMQEHHWQYLRIRPISFPTIRIAWFASLMQSMPLMQNLVHTQTSRQVLENIDVSEYWNSHYMFDKISKIKSKKMGNEFKAILHINVIAPLLYAYAKYSNDEKYRTAAFEILYTTKPETNAKIKFFDGMNLQQQHAFDTQALIALYDQYCSNKRCLKCGIGNKILRNNQTTNAINFA
ncbi:MAG TPA: DUF2851 family protein [Chitinophagales bacterium]|nr:DUF2851 family protein [Chitinophagales bacterium]